MALPLQAAFPSGPMLDPNGNVEPAWRGFFMALYVRTGEAYGVSTAGLSQAIAGETANRTAADTSLSNSLAAETDAREAADSSEQAARAAADATLTATKLAIDGHQAMTGTLVGTGATFNVIQTDGTGGPTWQAGNGAPTYSGARGSLYSRLDGAVGTTLYVCQSGTSWNPVAAV
jgi:hypothetical protein